MSDNLNITLYELLTFSKENQMTLDDAYDAMMLEKARDMHVEVKPELLAVAINSPGSLAALKEEARLREVLRNLVKAIPKTIIDEIRDRVGIYGVEAFTNRVQTLYLETINANKFELRPNVSAHELVSTMTSVAKENTMSFDFFEGTQSIDQIESKLVCQTNSPYFSGE